MTLATSEREDNPRRSLSRCGSAHGGGFETIPRSDSRRSMDCCTSNKTRRRNEIVPRSYSVGVITRKRLEESGTFRRRQVNNNNELLQSALSQNYNLHRVSSSSNISDSGEARSKLDRFNQLKRWNSSNHELKDLGMGDISPITIIQDEYNTRMPKQAYDFQNPDNSFRSLSRQTSETDISPHTDSKVVSDIPKVGSGAKLYGKMNKFMNLASNGVHSLIPQLSNLSGFHSVTSGISNFQSESDDDSEDEFPDEQLEITTMDSPKTELYPNFSSIQQEIEEFQNNFVVKFNENINNGKSYNNSSHKMSRIQKKVLDYKDLYNDENSTSSPSSSHPLIPNTGSGYNLKIRNEELINQYHSIRLRFSNRITANKNDTQYTSGLMGCIQRVSYNDKTERQNKMKNSSSEQLAGTGNITTENKNEYLQNLWNSEYIYLFPERKAEIMVIENEHKDLYSKKSISDFTSSINMSEIARNINIR